MPRLRRYVADRVKDRPAQVPEAVAAEVPISSGDEVVGAVLLARRQREGAADASEFLHLAAVASLTEVAVEEAKEEVEENLRGLFLEDLRSRPDLEPREIVRRAGLPRLRPLARGRSCCAPSSRATARATWWPRSPATSRAPWPSTSRMRTPRTPPAAASTR